ncbi:Rap1a/Tai family immunity protein [Methylobacterium sp. NFXW15]|uniref:Rap1a/Tai family immunity protein n=1 Tax=Methylobacterium sp. NFXW15 TaxID=2819512 RepID=UPI003CF0AED5
MVPQPRKPALTRTRIVLASTIIALSGLPSQAQFANGNKIYEWCQQPKGSLLREAVSAYLSGSLDTLVMSKNQQYEICIPEGVTIPQTRDVFCNYLDRHPEIRQRTAPVVLYQAISEAWPCKSAKP